MRLREEPPLFLDKKPRSVGHYSEEVSSDDRQETHSFYDHFMKPQTAQKFESVMNLDQPTPNSSQEENSITYVHVIVVRAVVRAQNAIGSGPRNRQDFEQLECILLNV